MAMRITPLLNISIDELSPVSALADIGMFEHIPIEERLTVSAIYGLIAKAAAAVGRPDAYAGEVPIAFVTLRAVQTVTTDELWAFAREHVSERPAAPAEVIILSEMPMTALGKIYKPDLRELAQSRTTNGEASKRSTATKVGQSD